jgi:hypothetical protein
MAMPIAATVAAVSTECCHVIDTVCT